MNKGKGRKGLIALEFLAMTLLMFIFGWGISERWEGWILGVLIFLIGLFVWGHWAAYYSLLPSLVPQEIHGTVYGLTNAIHFIGGFLAPWLTGLIKDSHSFLHLRLLRIGLIHPAGKPDHLCRPSRLPLGKRETIAHKVSNLSILPMPPLSGYG